MKIRIRFSSPVLSSQWNWLLLFGVIAYYNPSQAQCESPGDLFTLTYSGPNEFIVGKNSTGKLLFPLGAISVTPSFDSNTFSASLTGYNIGDDVPAGTNVTVYYIVSGKGILDTLCFDISFLDKYQALKNNIATQPDALPAKPVRTGNDYALFFVVTDFDYWADFPASTEKQVREIESELKAHYGFQTEFFLNPSRRQILDKLKDYQGKHFGKDDQLLLFFSMHGHFEEGGTGALIPKDGLLSDSFYDTWITHPLLADWLNRIPCDHILLSVDACYSGTFGGSRGHPDRKGWETAPDCADKCKQALRYKSRLYVTSGGAERTPTDSQFADKWLEALRVKNTDGLMSFHKLFGVLIEANPVPMYGEFRSHEKGGDFIFVDKEICQQAPLDADQQDWMFIQSYLTAERIKEHLKNFPNCPHEDVLKGLGIGFVEVAPDSEEKNSLEEPNLKGNDAKDKEIGRDKKNNASKNPVLKNIDLPDMILVQGDTFLMGRKNTSDQTLHNVALNDFYMGRFEVTFEEFDAFCDMIGKNRPDDNNLGRGKQPVVNVSWYDAIDYCNWLSESQSLEKVYTKIGKKIIANWEANGFRLPTEAEWEFAARDRGQANEWSGTDQQNTLASYANGAGINSSYSNPTIVGSLKPNQIGLHDMSGNVKEWCWDFYGYNYYNESPEKNPRGPENASPANRVVRGGSYKSGPYDLRCTNRAYRSPKEGEDDIGFRVVRSFD
ncbi:MAG: SUMF1/EgtB/PvdO family nonheme iron enzyme [Saprospiraceae bacterium]